MSDSDLSDAPSAPMPPDSELEKALRKQVRDALKTGDDSSITVSSIRKAAEEALGLDAGFYKKSEKWKEESKHIVHEAFEEYGADSTSPAKPKPKPQDAKPSKPSKPAPSKKRASPSDGEGVARKRKKSQTAASSEEVLSSLNSELSEPEKPTAKKPTKKSAPPNDPPKPKTSHKTNVKTSESEPSDAIDVPVPAPNAEVSDSELSVLIDEDPKPKKKRKASAPAEKRGRKPSAPKVKPNADVDPDQAEIKRLQGWLVKCGIRKLWGKELKPYESSKAKIKHLKDMLSEAGMSGRYSIEKASQIKEQRELRADIEAVQEGAERWGKNPDDEVDSDGRTRPKRKLVRGAQVLDFLSSDDGEETD